MERDDVRDTNFLSSIRNALILLVVGLALLEFGGRLSRVAPLILALVSLIFGLALYSYWSRRERPTHIDWLPYIVTVLFAVSLWIFWESLFR